MREYNLPNGLDVVVQTTTEADFFYQDIFEDRVYLQHGLTLPPDACVFDVGANIGMFTLFVHFYGVRPVIHAFEPAPPLFRILEENVERHGVDAHLHPIGVADAPGEAVFSFYPWSSGMSSFFGDIEEEKDILRRIMENQQRRGQDLGDVMSHAEDLLDRRFKQHSFTCGLRPLSDVIREQQIERIDLLKVDVQKAEHQVLAGLTDEDWPIVHQVALEVHDIDERLRTLTTGLRDRGFQVVAEQEPLYEGTNIYNVYAHRPGSQ